MKHSNAETAAETTGASAALFGRMARGIMGAVLLLLIAHFLAPQLRIITKALLPIPLALSYILFGPVVVIGLMGGVFLVLWGTVSLEQALAFATGGALLGLILGEQSRRGVKPFWSILIGTLAVSAVTLIGLQTVAPGVLLSADEAAFNSLFIGDSSDESPDVIEQLRSSIGVEEADRAIHYTMLILPALVVIGELLYVIVGFLLLRVAMRHVFGSVLVEAGSPVRFREWYAPDRLVFLAIVAGVALLLTDGIFHRLSLNCLILIGVIYVIQGLAVALNLGGRLIRSRSMLWAGLFLLVLVARQLVFPLAAAAGFMDVFIDFRKIRTKHIPPDDGEQSDDSRGD
ncbi:MAG: DUF2232 domain-containing protein [Candidatus Coatesbacteria bacterium]|nr:DUF2232 domain-containing protein [Candidatus Coatesbacteria bacterium]